MTGSAAIYSRFSTEMQSRASIEDQIRVCTAYLERDGWSVVQTYADYAVSGATALQPGYQALLSDARAKRFDIVVAESLDRFSRDQEHIASFYKLMSFAGVSVLTVAEEIISELHVGLKGTMSALFLKELAQKTHRGLEGRVRAGRSAGGLSYGYRVSREARADGATTGVRAIEEIEAAIVRRIFSDYAAGLSPRTIARANVPGPRGGRWTASLILGNAIRETGILRNRLYAGELVWNCQHFVKDPTSGGKRVARPNPRTTWIIEPVPALRIVEPELWSAVQQRLGTARQIVTGERLAAHTSQDVTRPNSRGTRLVAARRPPWLLSGLVRCGSCAGTMTVVGPQGRLGCANHRERGTCTNRRRVLRDLIATRVLTGLKHRLLAPELVEALVAEYIAEANLAKQNATSRRSLLQTQLTRAERQIQTMVETIADTGGSRALVEQLCKLEQRQDALREEITEAGKPESRFLRYIPTLPRSIVARSSVWSRRWKTPTYPRGRRRP